MEHGLTGKGFAAKPLHVILDEERAAYRNAFGEDIDLSNDSVDGAYVGNQAIKLTQLWEQLEGLWAQGDIDSASGVYLDRLANFVNVQRQAALPTFVYAALWGEGGTPIHAGHLVRLETGQKFRLTRTVVIDAASLLGVTFRVKETVEGAVFSFQISGSVISYTAGSDDTEETIQAALAGLLDPALYVIDSNGSSGVTVHSKEGIRPFSLAMADPKLEIILLGAFGIYQAETPGPLFVAIGTLNTIVTNVNGLNSVINYASGITGRNVESDTELRINLSGRQRQATANEIAIQNAVRMVRGVSFARVYSNRTMSYVNGRPPKSFEAVVVGGDELDIAETIFEIAPAGIEAFGNIIREIPDSEGFIWEIGFSRPTNKYIWIIIDYIKNHEEELPRDVIGTIQNNIVAWSLTAINVGVDLIFQRLFRPVVYDMPGIGYANIRLAATLDLTPPATSDYASENIVIGETEIAVIDTSRILVREMDEGL
jgi:uncharacterized phage protein gp47/JayE